MTNSDESDIKNGAHFPAPASPDTSREIQCVVFIGTIIQAIIGEGTPSALTLLPVYQKMFRK